MSKTKEVDAVKHGTANSIQAISQFHWSLRLMSLVSLFTLGLYSYVLQLCQREARRNAQARRNGEATIPSRSQPRIRIALAAFSLDLIISAYFSSITPILLKECGLVLNRRTMPRPLFWFFAVTGFVPTATMTITVLSGRKWHDHIRQKRAWRIFHGLTALVAYFSWWIACAPVFFIVLIGERRTIALLQRLNQKDLLRN